MDFGAVGNGKADDRVAVEAAVKHALVKGLAIDGGAAEYGIAGQIVVSHQVRPHVEKLRLRQLRPSKGQATLSFVDCQQVRIESLSLHVGSGKAVGHMDDTVGLLVAGGSDHSIRNVAATGDGNLTYIRFSGCVDSNFENIHVYDGEFENFEEERVTQDGAPLGTIRVPDDVVQGIHLADCTRCNLVNPVVRNLLGNATYFTLNNTVKPYRNLRTRGICGGGNIDCTVANAKVSNVEQGIDFSGGGNGWGNRAVVIQGGHTRNCGSVGVKYANAPNGCKVIGHIAENCGMYCYLLTGYDTKVRGSDNSFIGCDAINPGYNDIRSASDTERIVYAGFRLLQSFPAGLIGSRLLNCRAIDKQGFYLATDDSPWAPVGARQATIAEAWTGFTGQYEATFTTSEGPEKKTVTLTAGSAVVQWRDGLAAPVVHPFVSRPAKMRYGASCEAPYDPSARRPNTIVDFESAGHLVSAARGFQ
jgi:hypothetical protein